MTLLAEASTSREPSSGNKSSAEKSQAFTIHRVFKGAKIVGDRKMLSPSLDAALMPGTLALVFGKGEPSAALDELSFTATPVNETAYAYFAQAPDLRTPSAERLSYFAKYLEHSSPLVAEDAYLEFGHAPYAQVAAVAGSLPMARIRQWLSSPDVPQSRKGFYGLALGLAPAASDRQANAALLQKLIAEPADDFRAGFDGLLGGYLILKGETALKEIETRFLSNPSAASGDVRHAVTALRFYHEFGRQIPQARLASAMRLALGWPEVAERAIVDLARWQAWHARAQIAGMYAEPKFDDPLIRRAIVGYLRACPDSAAADDLERLRAVDSGGVAAAESVLSILGGAGTDGATIRGAVQ